MPFSPSGQTASNVGELTEVLLRSIEPLLFVCSATLNGVEVLTTPSDQSTANDLFSRVFVRANLSCRDAMEVPYYSSQSFGPLCSNCACECQESVGGQYPLCVDCRANGVMPLLKRKRKNLVPASLS